MMKQMLAITLLALVLGNPLRIEPVEQMQLAHPAQSKVMSITSIRSASVTVPVQLATGGCCTLPFWSSDGKRVLYIDRPAGGKLGIYGVTPEQPEPLPTLVSERVEDSRIIGPYRVETTRTATTLVRLSDGKKFPIPAQGRNVQFSPDFSRVAWSITDQNLPSERQVAAIWVANVDGSAAKRVATLRRGGVGGWLSASTLLVNATDPNNRAQSVLYSLSVGDGKLTEILRTERLRSATLSPSGKWIAYYTAFNDSGGNGLWVIDTNGGKSKAAPTGAFGAFQWRQTAAGDRLVVVPFRPEAQYHEFWQLDPETLSLTQLTRASETPVKIANGDWRVSPDGRFVAYVESKDRNIWAVPLP